MPGSVSTAVKYCFFLYIPKFKDGELSAQVPLRRGPGSCPREQPGLSLTLKHKNINDFFYSRQYCNISTTGPSKPTAPSVPALTVSGSVTDVSVYCSTGSNGVALTVLQNLDGS